MKEPLGKCPNCAARHLWTEKCFIGKAKEMKTVKIEKIYQLNIWVERDFCGSNHIMMQHEGFGEPFCYGSLHYSYAYTSNSTIHIMTEKFMELLGVEAKDIVWKSRGFKPLKWWMKAIMPIFNIYWKFKLCRLRKAQEK